MNGRIARANALYGEAASVASGISITNLTLVGTTSIGSGAVLTNPTINGATLTGSLSMSAAADLILAAGAFISLPSLTVDNAPTIRAAASTGRGIWYRNDEGRVKVITADGRAVDCGASEIVGHAAVAEGGNISLNGSKAPIVIVTLSSQAGASVTAGSIDDGAFDRQIAIFTSRGTGSVDLPNGSYFENDGNTATQIGQDDTAIYTWSTSEDAWVQGAPRAAS